MPAETVLITGASSGIGLEFAKLFAADRCHLVLVARRKRKLEALAKQLRAEHQVKVTVVVQDLAEAGGPSSVARQLQEKGLPIDALVNNAGIGSVGKLAELALERQLAMVRLNVIAVTELTRRFLPGMLQRGRGAILNVASTAAFQPGGNMAVYFATKAYILSLTEALAEEVRGTGVTITCLCPGPTQTELGALSGANETLLFRLGTMKAQTVAKRGYRALRRGKAVEIPGVVSRLLVFSLRFTPRWIARRVAARLVSSE